TSRSPAKKGVIVNKGIIGIAASSLVAKAILLGTLFAASGTAIAGSSDADRVYPPGGAGRYAIGHTTLVLTDASRNVDGSTPATSSGRPLYLHIWYPTTTPATQHVLYTWNDPVYNHNPGGTVYPGLPDLPALSFTGSMSLNPVADRAPLAREKFPLLIAS